MYALLSGRARSISGGFMIGGGIWLALTRARRNRLNRRRG
jgi:hypothetical protein